MKRIVVKKLRDAYHKLIHINDTPEKIAMGFAVGAFVGVFPTFWLGGVMILGICYVFRLSYAGAILGSVIIMNPITTPIFWALSAGLGSLIFSGDTQQVIASLHNKTVFHQFGKIALIYLTGNLIISIVVSVASYFVVKKIIILRRKIENEDKIV